MANAEPKRATRFGGSTPIFRVEDLEASLDHYRRALGFEVEWKHPEIAAGVRRGDCSIFLIQRDQGHAGGWAWVGVADVEALHDELRASGATIRLAPTNYSWGREMQVTDPDGNVLRMGSDRKPGEPDGDWMDMNGVRWRKLPDGGWERVE